MNLAQKSVSIAILNLPELVCRVQNFFLLRMLEDNFCNTDVRICGSIESSNELLDFSICNIGIGVRNREGFGFAVSVLSRYS